MKDKTNNKRKYFTLTYKDLCDRFDFCSWETEGKMGVIDKNGTWLLPPIHDYVHVIQEDVIHVRDGGENRLVTLNGNLIRAVEFDRAVRLFWFGEYYALRKGEAWAIADFNFSLLTEYTYEKIILQVAPTIHARKNGKEILSPLKDKKGNIVQILPEFKCYSKAE